jgi:VWFA-related protein
MESPALVIPMSALPRPRISAISAAAVAMAIVIGALASNSWSRAGVASAQDQPRFKVESELVVLHVTVKNRNGSFAPGLSTGAFQVWEDGRPQAIRFFADEDAPVTVGLVIDSSGSMQSARDRVIAASTAFVETSNPQDEVFALVFNDDVRPVLAASAPFTSDVSTLGDALRSVFVPRGRTALHDAVADGLAYVAKGTRDRRVLVVLSDGGDNASRMAFKDLLMKAQASNVVIYTVGLVDPADSDANPRRLKQLAEATGGEAFEPPDVAQVARVLQQVALDIRHGYTIGYAPTDERQQPALRRIRVEARSPDGRRLVTRTRTGYLARRAEEKSHAQ